MNSGRREPRHLPATGYQSPESMKKITIEDVTAGQSARRELWQQKVYSLVDELFHTDGSGKYCYMNPPWREPLWLAGTLFHGSDREIGLANRVIARYGNLTANDHRKTGVVDRDITSLEFNIFNSTICACLLNIHRDKLSKEALEVITYHTKLAMRTYDGAGAPDYNFHGCNDNMPCMSTRALLLGGEALGDPTAVRQGKWKLRQLARHLGRCAWLSEYNSSTYTPVSMLALTQIYNHVNDQECRQIAKKVIERLWAEILLHFHPGTKLHAGPQCRGYAVDQAGHTHSLSILMHTVLGPEYCGRDIVESYFNNDGVEILHFNQSKYQNIAEASDFIDEKYYFPKKLLRLVNNCRYPAVTAGRTEMLAGFAGEAAETYTRNYMEKEFSLGTSGQPLCGGAQTLNFFATYQRKPVVTSAKDSGTVFCRYRLDDAMPSGTRADSTDRLNRGETFIPNQGSIYAVSERNQALVTTFLSPERDFDSDNLALTVVFSAHYGRIGEWIIGNHKNAAISDKAEPVSLAAGQVYIFIQPLLPTMLQRNHAVEFRQLEHYQELRLINYEGPRRHFTGAEIELVQNGFWFVIEPKHRYRNLAQFHQRHAKVKVLDYFFSNRRFLRVDLGKTHFELVHSIRPFGVNHEAVNGRVLAKPYFESTRLDVNTLPLVKERPQFDDLFFGWGDSLKMANLRGSWQIGSDGQGENYRFQSHGME